MLSKATFAEWPNTTSDFSLRNGVAPAGKLAACRKSRFVTSPAGTEKVGLWSVVNDQQKYSPTIDFVRIFVRVSKCNSVLIFHTGGLSSFSFQTSHVRQETGERVPAAQNFIECPCVSASSCTLPYVVGFTRGFWRMPKR